MEIRFTGKKPRGVTSKDMILAVIGKMGIAGGNGSVAEYTGESVRGLSMEARMTMCNMTIEGGARAQLQRLRDGQVLPTDWRDRGLIEDVLEGVAGWNLYRRTQ